MHRSRLPWLTLIMVVCAACSGEPGGDPAGPEEPELPQGDPDAVLECDRAGYPCTTGDTPSEILRRTASLADSSASRFADG